MVGDNSSPIEMFLIGGHTVQEIVHPWGEILGMRLTKNYTQIYDFYLYHIPEISVRDIHLHFPII